METLLPVQNPILFFVIILSIILIAPIVSKLLRIPSIISLIVAGMVFGPYGLNILPNNETLQLFSKIGLLYIVFLSGIEIDMNEFKCDKNKSLVFGLITFAVPVLMGLLSGHYLMGLGMSGAIILATLYSAQTLLAYPIVSRYGIAKNQAVNIIVGGTIVCVTLSLIILAFVSGMYKGEVNTRFFIRLAANAILLGFMLFWILPHVAQFVFKRFSNSVLLYVFILLLVLFSSYLSELAGLESLLGAFLIGLSLNRFIPNLSPLMSKINFVGNALFIPIFLISVGMIVNIQAFFTGYKALIFAGIMTTVALSSKWIAAQLTQLIYKLSPLKRNLIFGLSCAKVSVSLAVVMIGYNIILPNGERILGESILNATIIMILITCTVSSVVTERTAKRIALTEDKSVQENESEERVLIPLSNPETCDGLMELALLLVEKKASKLFAMSVSRSTEEEVANSKILERAVKIGASSEKEIFPVSQLATNVSMGIENVVEQKNISDIVVGLHHKSTDLDSFFGSIISNMLLTVEKTLYIYKRKQPLNTLNRIVVAVPANAEVETGFVVWLDRIRHLSKQVGATVCFYANRYTTAELERLCAQKKHALSGATFKELNDWEDFLIVANEIQRNDLLVVISARKQTASYNQLFERLPGQLTRSFTHNSYLVLYPSQAGTHADVRYE